MASLSIEIKSADQLARMREAGRIVHRVLEELRRASVPGRTTDELDRLAHRRTLAFGARPAFLNYFGYPKSLCASLNDEVVHGVPSRRRALREGDLLKLDFGAALEGFFCDAAITVEVGRVSPEASQLARAAQEALALGIAAARPGNRVSDIGAAIEARAAEYGFEIVRTFVGHGIGRSLHEAPPVPSYRREPRGPSAGRDPQVQDEDVQLEPGMALAIEPMLNAGDASTRVLEDRWTAVTADSRLSAHFEHTVAVTSGEPVILTRA